jgi:hypothetical protein
LILGVVFLLLSTPLNGYVYSADKKAIIAAWKKGIPVDGTRVERKQRVVYALTATAIQDFKDSILP